jgi:hypothetical protein
VLKPQKGQHDMSIHIQLYVHIIIHKSYYLYVLIIPSLHKANQNKMSNIKYEHSSSEIQKTIHLFKKMAFERTRQENEILDCIFS